MLLVAIGHSEDVDVEDILEEIIEQCEEQLAGHTPKAGLLFAAVDLEYQEILNGLMAKWPELDLIGCSTDGEFSSQLGFVEDSVSLTLFASDTIDITAGIGKSVGEDIPRATKEAVETAMNASDEKPKLCIATPASMVTSSDQIVANLKNVLGENVQLLGANAGDQWRFVVTHQFFKTEIFTDAVPLLLFSGPLIVSSGVHSGWNAVGKVGVVTKSDNNIVFKIDDKTALDFYRDLLGKDAVPTGDRPLAILTESGHISRLRASIEQFDEEVGSVTFFGDIPEGSKVQITIATRSDILEGTRLSVSRAKEKYPEGHDPVAAIFFSCSGRKLLLGTQTEEEYSILKTELGSELPVSGFYGYGEIGPALEDVSTDHFHNETFVTILLGSE